MKNTFLICLLVPFFSFTQGLVDGYMKGKGNTDLALSYTSQNSTEFWGGTNLYNIPRSINSIGLYAIHGITNRIDVLANIPFINGQFQDGALMLKFALVNKNLSKSNFTVISALGISAPLSNYQIGGALAIGQQAIQILPKLILQWKHENGIFLQTQGGYNYTLTPVPSSIPFSVKAGIAKNKIYADLWFDYQKGLGNLDYPTPSENFRKLTVDYTRFGGVFFVNITKKIGAFVNSAYTLAGRNTSKSFSIGAGLVFKFSKKAKE